MDKKISRAALFDALNSYHVPGTSASLVTLKAVKGIDVSETDVRVGLQLLDAAGNSLARHAGSFNVSAGFPG